jgi:hypothetical protein
MDTLRALPSQGGLCLADVVVTPTTAVALLASVASSATCHRCGTQSNRVHSRYTRTIADLPGSDRPLVLRLIVRRFRCGQPSSSQAIFCERLPAIATAHATGRSTEAQRALGFALGGEAGSRLAAPPRPADQPRNSAGSRKRPTNRPAAPVRRGG